MTEKRYFKEDFYDEYAIKKEDNIIAIVDSGSNARKICDELNTLEKENEQLKFQLENTCYQRDEFYYGARENANRVGKLKKENEQLKKGLKDWKYNCLSSINENSILWNEIAIMRKQGAKPSSAFEEYCSKFKGDVE